MSLAILATGTPAAAASTLPTNPSGVASGWGYADFDGDSQPDLVEHRRNFLDLRLSTGRELHLASVLDTSTPGSEIVVVDLDGDHDLDIVIRNRFLNQHPDIWLNDGEGFFIESGTHDFPLPFKRTSWSQSPNPGPGTAVNVRNSKPLGIEGESWFLPSLSSGRTLHTVRSNYPLQDPTHVTCLRGPPISSFR
jgi:hypothetical protein